ncbi:nucleotidyltransferase family protein [Sulfurisphaera tokodaii]|uniref:Sugar-phosphate nucleotidyltransferase n=2 Tax=Sulfurisphaera tokodaii TaxID=111955 RepID=Q973C6_SULTO|nr:nucleotidyltransferase family protein [Sulfurisphaera tokodaii]BAB65987.1 putative sugar-phosphate nucleotidyltransferase [Sulfurisphaera tokodaii str. 7]HII73948.1 nucleotidyltransferase family protein [Sulfurisphaera tokodaii]
MKAVILAGGYGKRLRPLTDDKPKPLVEVAGKPIIEWQIHWLKSFGITSFFVLAGYKKEALIEWISKNQQRLNVSIATLTEEEPLGTGGAIRRLKDFISDDFIVINGDILTNIDINKMVLKDCIVAIALVPLRSPYGIVSIDDNGKIIRFVEKPLLKEYWINAGVYKMKPEVFEYLPEKGDIEKITFPSLAEKGLLKGVTYENVYWRSIDTIKDYEEASVEIPEVFKKL